MKEMSTIKFPNQIEPYEIVDAFARTSLENKSPVGHTHTRSDITNFAHEHDERYYTEVEIDAKVIELKEYTDSQIGNIPSVDAYTKDQIDTLLTEVRDYADAAVEPLETKEDAQSKYDIITEAKADWNQNNEGAIDYIKNRTHWVESGQAVEVINCQLQMSGTLGGVSNSLNQMDFNEPLIIGETYQALFDGITYTNLTPVNDEEQGVILYIFDTGTSSVYLVEDTQTLYAKKYSLTTSDVFQLMRGSSENVYHTLDANFIPDSIARQVDVQNVETELKQLINEAKEYSDANLEVAQAYADTAKTQAITEGANSAVNTINTKLTNDYYDKDQIDNYVLITVADIDAIWAYQSGSSNGLITFEINDGGLECQAEEGMTWSEWVNSDYCDKSRFALVGYTNKEVTFDGQTLYAYDVTEDIYVTVYSTDIIMANFTYESRSMDIM